MSPLKSNELVFGTLWELNKSLVKKRGKGGDNSLGWLNGSGRRGRKKCKIILFSTPTQQGEYRILLQTEKIGTEENRRASIMSVP